MRPLPGALAPSDPAQASTCRLAPDRGDLPAVTSPDRTEPAATVVRLEALPDEFVNGDRLTLNVVTTGGVAYGAGSVDGSFEIEVRDTNLGETFSVAVSGLFEGIAPGSTVAYSASSSDPSAKVPSSSTVTVTAVSAGSVAVRVTARVTGASAAVPQTRRDEAAVEHSVTDVPLRVTLTADPRRRWKRASPSPCRRVRTGRCSRVRTPRCG